MFAAEQYELLDIADGRKLERFGAVTVDRPSPAAVGFQGAANAWRADLRYERTGGERGEWSGASPDPWAVRHGRSVFDLKPTPFGHVGLFPEQAVNWDWIERHCRAAGQPLRVLNLFAYTGGSTLAAAAVGAHVVHVDSARNVVSWARRNAERSGLSDAPIRWICEDAVRFVQREARRGNTYDAVILDPPSYGHGPKGEVWRVQEHLPSLLEQCASITRRSRRFVLLTCHSPEIGAGEARALLSSAMQDATAVGQIEAVPLTVATRDGRRLDCGVVARWASGIGSSGIGSDVQNSKLANTERNNGTR